MSNHRVQEGPDCTPAEDESLAAVDHKNFRRKTFELCFHRIFYRCNVLDRQRKHASVLQIDNEQVVLDLARPMHVVRYIKVDPAGQRAEDIRRRPAFLYQDHRPHDHDWSVELVSAVDCEEASAQESSVDVFKSDREHLCATLDYNVDVGPSLRVVEVARVQNSQRLILRPP